MLRHTSGIPMLAVGHGEFRADDNLGNWNLSVTEENRLELDLFDVLSKFVYCQEFHTSISVYV